MIFSYLAPSPGSTVSELFVYLPFFSAVRCGQNNHHALSHILAVVQPGVSCFFVFVVKLLSPLK